MTAIMMKTPEIPVRSKMNTAANGMTAPATLPMPLTTEVPSARTRVGYNSGDHRASVEFRNSEKNWKIDPKTRIKAAPSANSAKQMAETHPRTAAIATVRRRGNRAATRAAARAPNMLPAYMIIVKIRLVEIE